MCFTSMLLFPLGFLQVRVVFVCLTCHILHIAIWLVRSLACVYFVVVLAKLRNYLTFCICFMAFLLVLLLFWAKPKRFRASAWEVNWRSLLVSLLGYILSCRLGRTQKVSRSSRWKLIGFYFALWPCCFGTNFCCCFRKPLKRPRKRLVPFSTYFTCLVAMAYYITGEETRNAFW